MTIIIVKILIYFIDNGFRMRGWCDMIDKVQELIHDNDNIVVLSDIKVDYECNLDGMRAEKRSFDVELEYGYSPEEIMTEKFLRNRAELFYRYYKNNVLTMDKMHPSPAHYAMASLEKQGKLLGIITRSIYGLHQMAGASNIFELHGNLHNNSCPKCDAVFSAEYVLNAVGVPHCKDCNVALRPGVTLFGENLDNGLASKCSAMVEKANLLLIVGGAYDTYLARVFLPYYNGVKLVIINDEETAHDDMATYVLKGKCKDILPMLVRV